MEFQFNGAQKGKESDIACNNVVLKALEAATMMVPGLNSDGWRCIVKKNIRSRVLVTGGFEHKTVWHLNVSPEVGCGHECAEKKILTLQDHLDIRSTSELRDKSLTIEQNKARIAPYVFWYGGIRVPMTNTEWCVSGEDDLDFREEYVEYLAAFSGSREDIDAFIITYVILKLIKHLEEENRKIYTSVDFGSLEKDPVIGSVLKLLRTPYAN
jgi:hypothetical protein